MPHVSLHHAHATSAGNGPGLLDLPQDEAQALVDAGYARFMHQDPPPDPEPEPPVTAEPAPEQAAAAKRPAAKTGTARRGSKP